MDVLRATALEKEINRQIRERSYEITEAIIEGCEEADSAEAVYGKMVANAVAVSVKMSIGTILDILIDLGIVESHDEEQLRKNILSVVK